jgi:hypothetical protein
MAQQPKTAVEAADGIAAEDARHAAERDLPRDLPPLHFCLRQLLLFVAAVSMLLAGLVTLQGLPALALLLASLVIAFHLLSTAIGSRLRLYGNAQAAHPCASPPSAMPAPHLADPPLPPLARPMPWYGRTEVSYAWLPTVVAAAVVLGGSLGAVLVSLTAPRATLPALVVGAISLAALSGWDAFLSGNFLGNLRRGLGEAVAEPPPMQPAPSGNRRPASHDRLRQ